MKVLLVGILPAYDASYSLGLSAIKAYTLKRVSDLQEHIEISIELFSTQEILDQYDCVVDINLLLDRICGLSPDIIGFSCYVWNMEPVLHLSRLLKLLVPNVCIVLGGPEVSAVAEEVLSLHPFIDIIVRGEGEQAFAEVVLSFITGQPSLDDVKGISFHQDQVVKRNASRAPLDHLDKIPSIRLSGLVSEMQNKRRIIWETCRGCPFGCHYCYYSGDNKHHVRTYSMERIKSELLSFCEEEVEWVTCVDGTFNFDPQRTCEILEFIRVHNRRTKFLFSVKVELLNRECIAILNALAEEKALGEIEIGLQSANPEALVRINRSWDSHRFLDNLSLFSPSLRAITRIDLMYGLPGDNYAGFKNSLGYVIGSLGIHRISAYRLNVLPGTHLYQHPDAFGLVFDKCPPHYVYSTDSYSYEDILRSKTLAASLCLLEGSIERVCSMLTEELRIELIDILEQYAAWRYRENRRENDRRALAESFFIELCLQLGRCDLILPILSALRVCAS